MSTHNDIATLRLREDVEELRTKLVAANADATTLRARVAELESLLRSVPPLIDDRHDTGCCQYAKHISVGGYEDWCIARNQALASAGAEKPKRVQRQGDMPSWAPATISPVSADPSPGASERRTTELVYWTATFPVTGTCFTFPTLEEARGYKAAFPDVVIEKVATVRTVITDVVAAGEKP